MAGQGYKHRSLRRNKLHLYRSVAAEVLPPLDMPCDQMEDHRIPKQLLFGELEQGHRRQGRPCKRFKDTVKPGLQWCGLEPTELVATALDRQRWCTLTQFCVICARGRASPPSTVRQRTPPLGSLSSSNKCELPVSRLRTALQVQDLPAESLLYPQIRGTDNVILETEGPP